jgi:hypothetical protein
MTDGLQRNRERKKGGRNQRAKKVVQDWAEQSRAEQRKDRISSIFTNSMMYNTQDTVCLTLSSLDEAHYLSRVRALGIGMALSR